MAQKKFAVTGVAGHTGSCTVERLLERGHAVRALAHREDDRSKRLQELGAEVVIGDTSRASSGSTMYRRHYSAR